jgi:hypothetical protein
VQANVGHVRSSQRASRRRVYQVHPVLQNEGTARLTNVSR